MRQVILVLIGLCLAVNSALALTLPELPRVYVDTTMPTTKVCMTKNLTLPLDPCKQLQIS